MTFYALAKVASNVSLGMMPPPGILNIQVHENDLRTHLLRQGTDGVDIVILVDEDGVEIPIDDGILIDEVTAWRSMTDLLNAHVPVIDNGIYVVIVVESDSSRRPHREYADAVILTAGTVEKFEAAPWVGPIAHRIADRYGARVAVSYFGREPDIDPEPAAPIVIRQAFSAELCDAVRASMTAFERSPDKLDPDAAILVDLGQSSLVGTTESRTPLDLIGIDLLGQIGVDVAGQLGLPVSKCVRHTVLRYTTGAFARRHTDRNREEPSSYWRTVSVTIPLNDDFGGGQFVTDFGTADAGPGDAIGLTSMTPHEITAVTGVRDSVALFFAWEGWR